VEAATGRTAWTVGKPEPQLFVTALDRLGEGRALVVGDRLDADVGGASAAGLDAALVLTGATSEEEAREALAAAMAKRTAPPPPGADAPPRGGLVAVAPTLASLLLS
jgi:ribonucleotide monophosphatase NagD (HAD superfamily)